MANEYRFSVDGRIPVLKLHHEPRPPPGYVEYPESDHFMRSEDWNDLWNRALGFLRWHLS